MTRDAEDTAGAELLRDLTTPENDHDPVRARIVDAGYAAMLHFGIRRMTMDDVAKRAGVGRPTLYRRFSDKREIVRTVWLRESRRLFAEVWQEVQNESSPEELVARAFVVATRKLGRHELLQRLLVTDPEAVLSLITTEAGPIIDATRALIAERARPLQDAGHLTTIDLEDLLEMLARLFVSITFMPSSRVSVSDDAALDHFAERALLPLLVGMRRTTM